MGPEEAIYRRALGAIGVAADEAIFIGDHPESDVLGPRALGMRAIHFDPRRQHAMRQADDLATLRKLLMAMLAEEPVARQ